MPTLHEAAAMETPAPSSVATAVPRTSPAKPTTLQMETPMPSASQLARALELGAKLTAASPVGASELGISSSWNRMSTETVEQAQFRDLLHTSKLIRPASAIPDNEPELPPPPSPPASPSFLLGGAAAALAADEEEPTPLQSTIVSVASVCAAHPSPPFTSPQVAATSPYIETKLEDGSPVAIVVAEQPPVALAPMIGHMKARMAQLKDWLDDDDLVVR